MVCKLFAALACLGVIGADDLSRIARDLRAPRRLWFGAGIECWGNGQHSKLDTELKSSGWFWAREQSLTTSITYEPAGILDALEVQIAFDRNGDGRIENSEWQLAGRDDAHDAEGKTIATVRDAPLASGNVGWRIVERNRDGTSTFDQWLDGGLTAEDH